MYSSTLTSCGSEKELAVTENADSSQGGWWQASDGKWYPPEAASAPPPPPPSAATARAKAWKNDAAPPSAPPPVRRSALPIPVRIAIGVVGALLLIAALASANGTPLFGGSGGTAGSSNSSVYDRVTGEVEIVVGFGNSCSQLGGYSDVPRMQMIVRDRDGSVLGTLRGLGQATEGRGDITCRVLFRGNDLPKRDSYVIDAGSRGEMVVYSSEFNQSGSGATEIFSFSLGG